VSNFDIKLKKGEGHLLCGAAPLHPAAPLFSVLPILNQFPECLVLDKPKALFLRLTDLFSQINLNKGSPDGLGFSPS